VAGREWRATIPDSDVGTQRRVLGSSMGPATGAPYTEIGYIAGVWGIVDIRIGSLRIQFIVLDSVAQYAA
jgi:hypothetical protein